MKNIMKEAHNLTKKIIKKGDSYRATFRLCLSFIHTQVKKGVKKMVGLKGSEKQIKWANDIRRELLSVIEDAKEHKIQVVSKREDKVKKDGTIITASDRVEKTKNIFDNLVEIIINNEESVFFIENFNSLTSEKRDLFRRFSVEQAFDRIEELNKFAKYFQYR